MKFLTVEMDNFIKERVLYEVKVNKLSPADAHDKAKQALKDLILRVYGAETKAIYIKDYGLKPDVALQAAVSDCKIKIETYFDTKAPKVGKQSDEVVWTIRLHLTLKRVIAHLALCIVLSAHQVIADCLQKYQLAIHYYSKSWY